MSRVSACECHGYRPVISGVYLSSLVSLYIGARAREADGRRGVRPADVSVLLAGGQRCRGREWRRSPTLTVR